MMYIFFRQRWITDKWDADYLMFETLTIPASLSTSDFSKACVPSWLTASAPQAVAQEREVSSNAEALLETVNKSGQHRIACPNRAFYIDRQGGGKECLILSNQDAPVAAHGDKHIGNIMLVNQFDGSVDDFTAAAQCSAKGVFQLVDVWLDQVWFRLQALHEQTAIGIKCSLTSFGNHI